MAGAEAPADSDGKSTEGQICGMRVRQMTRPVRQAPARDMGTCIVRASKASNRSRSAVMCHGLTFVSNRAINSGDWTYADGRDGNG